MLGEAWATTSYVHNVMLNMEDFLLSHDIFWEVGLKAD